MCFVPRPLNRFRAKIEFSAPRKLNDLSELKSLTWRGTDPTGMVSTTLTLIVYLAKQEARENAMTTRFPENQLGHGNSKSTKAYN